MTTDFETGAFVLGYVGLTASWRRSCSDVKLPIRRQPMLVIQACADTDEGAHTPAASITICSTAGLRALKAAVDEALRHEPEDAK